MQKVAHTLRVFNTLYRVQNQIRVVQSIVYILLHVHGFLTEQCLTHNMLKVHKNENLFDPIMNFLLFHC